MGRVYDGPYADLVGAEHEGYPARVSSSGSATGRCSVGTAEFRAYLAACGCGWHGDVAYPPTGAGAGEALAEWESDHLRPLITQAAGSWSAWAEQVAGRARAVAGHVGKSRPDRALLVLERLVEDAQSRLRIVQRLVAEKSDADQACCAGRGFEGVGR